MNAAETTFTLPLGEPVRFLAIEWREDWEFDNPAVLVSPVFRYSPNGTSLESMIEDAANDILINAENGKPTNAGPCPGDLKEFEWRGWDVAKIRAAAEAAGRGEKVKLGTGSVQVQDDRLIFKRNPDGEIEFKYSS